MTLNHFYIVFIKIKENTYHFVQIRSSHKL